MYKTFIHGFTCNECTNRKVGCHSNCEKYLNELKKYREIQQKINDAKDREHYFDEFYRRSKAIKFAKNKKNG